MREQGKNQIQPSADLKHFEVVARQRTCVDCFKILFHLRGSRKRTKDRDIPQLLKQVGALRLDRADKPDADKNDFLFCRTGKEAVLRDVENVIGRDLIADAIEDEGCRTGYNITEQAIRSGACRENPIA